MQVIIVRLFSVTVTVSIVTMTASMMHAALQQSVTLAVDLNSDGMSR